MAALGDWLGCYRVGILADMGSGNCLVWIQRLMATVAMGLGQFQRFLSCDPDTGLHKTHCNSYTCFYIFKVFFPCSVLPPQKGFLFEFGFLLSEYDMTMWGLFWVFFYFSFWYLSCLMFFEPPGSMVCCHSFWEILGHFYFKYFLSSLFLCVCSIYIHITFFKIVPQFMDVPEFVCFFLIFLSLHFILASFNWYILKSTDSSLV